MTEKSNRQALLRSLVLLVCVVGVVFVVSGADRREATPTGIGLHYFDYAYYIVRYPTLIALAFLPVVFLLLGTSGPAAPVFRRVSVLLPWACLLTGGAVVLHHYYPAWRIMVPSVLVLVLVIYLFRHTDGRAVMRMLAGLRRCSWLPVWLGLWGMVVCLALNWWMHRGGAYMGDSHARLWHAQMLAWGRWWWPLPERADLFFGGWAVWDFENGRWYSQYTPGGIVLCLVGLKTGLVYLPFGVAAGLAVASTVGIARHLFGRTIALVSGVLMLFSPMFLLLGSSCMDHVPAMACLTTALWSGLHARGRWLVPYILIAGFLLGLACTMRPLTVLGVAGPLLLVFLFHTRREGWVFVTRWGLLGLAGVLPLAGLLYFNYKTTGDPFLLGYRVSNPTLHSLGFTEANGHTPLMGLSYQANNLVALSQWLHGWPLTSYLPLMLLFIVGRWNRRDLLLLVPIVGLPVAYFFYPYQDFCFSPRFLAEIIPFLAILSARGLLAMFHARTMHCRWISRRAWAGTMIAAVLAFGIAGLPFSIERFDHFARDSAKGRSLMRTFMLFQDKPDATVFYGKTSHAQRSLLATLYCWGGARFYQVMDQEERVEYMRNHPDRDCYYVSGPRAQGDFWRIKSVGEESEEHPSRLGPTMVPYMAGPWRERPSTKPATP